MDKNIYTKLQQVRIEVNKKCTKKTGKNQYFDYFQLQDFLGVANEEFAKQGLCPIFNIRKDSVNLAEGMIEGWETATLTIYSEDGQSIEFTTPTAQAKLNSNNPIQELGAKHTYLKRYLYMNALELSEGDIVDASHQEDRSEKKATEKQIGLLKSLYQEHEKLLEFCGVKAFEDISMKMASDLISKKKEQPNE